MNTMQHWIKEVARGKRGSKDLTYEQAVQAARTIIDGNYTEAQLAAFLIGERLKVESPEELLAFVEQFESETVKLDLSPEIQGKMIDFASPYTGRHSFFTTIPVSLLLAERNIPVFLHSSKTLPPKYGTTLIDVFHALSVKTEQGANEIKKNIEEFSIGFAITEDYCRPLSDIRKVREEIYVRTLFNTAEKLMNISNAKSIVLGAFHRTAINKIYPIFEHLPFDQVYIVQGVEGSEDLPVHRSSFIYKIANGEMESFIVNPKDYDLFVDEDKLIPELTVDKQAEMVRKILGGHKEDELTYYQNQVIFNAGIRYYIFGYENSIEAGIAYAKEQLNKGVALETLNKWINFNE